MSCSPVQFLFFPFLTDEYVADCLSAVCLCLRLVNKQGIDRSHSWVNSAYAPGGSRAVLRRNPNSSCEPKQVLRNIPYLSATTKLSY